MVVVEERRAERATRAGAGLRVLMVVQRLLPYLAGAETQALSLGAALEARGVSVRFVSTRYVAGLDRAGVVRGMPVERLAVARGPLLKPSQLAATAARVARAGRHFDVVHAHCVSAASLGAIVGARAARLPVLIKPSLGGPVDGEIAKLARAGGSSVMVPILRRADRFAALDEEIADELRAIGAPESRIERVDNGVDLEAFSPADPARKAKIRVDLGLPVGGLVVAFVGQMTHRKGVLETLEAWRALGRRHPQATLVLAGEGAEAESVRAEAERSGGRVRYLGGVDDVASVLRASDAFVLPSRNDSFGNAVVEALACGLPVVTCRTGIASRLDLDGAAGRMLEGPVPAEIARALDKILSDAELRRAYGARARELVTRFGYDRVAVRYVEIYESMVDANV